MLKKINKYFNLSIASSILFIILGIIILIFPKISLSIFSYLIGISAILLGIYLIYLEVRYGSIFTLIDTSLSGILSILLGIIILIYPKTVAIFIPIVLGIWFIMSSFMKLRISYYLKYISGSLYLSTLIMNILSVICGIIFIINPLTSSTVITIYIAILLIIYSISNLSEIIILKKNINNIDKYLQKEFKEYKIIDEK